MFEVSCSSVDNRYSDVGNLSGVQRTALAIRWVTEGRSDQAVELLQKVVREYDSIAEAWSTLGTLLKQRGHCPEAEACLTRALRLAPTCHATHNNLANLYLESRRHKLALAHYRKALELCPGFPDARSNLAKCLSAMGKTAEAVREMESLLGEEPDKFSHHFNLGTIWLHAFELERALAEFRICVELNPDSAIAWANVGSSLVNLNLFCEAEPALRRAMALDAELVEPRWNLAICLLRQGRFAEGWQLHEWRRKLPEYSRTFASRPQWNGERMPDATVLLYAEQGLGDTLQFIRYAAWVRERVGRVVLGCQPPLRGLLSRVDGVDAVFCYAAEIPEHDAVCPLLSLPMVFGTDLDSVPAQVPYLSTSRESAVLPPRREGVRRAGIVWGGSPTHAQDRLRSVPLAWLEPWFRVPGWDWCSLQVGAASAELLRQAWASRVADLSSHLKDFEDTAAVVAELDLVVTVDTSVAHLAGAMGKPVWVLVQYAPDWRWMLGREDSPWYPTVRLFRQTQFADWAEPIARVASALEEWQ